MVPYFQTSSIATSYKGFPMWRRAWYRDDVPFVARIVNIFDINGFRLFLKGTLWTKDDDKTIWK